MGAGAVPKCHKAALLPFPSGTKSLLCPQPGRSNMSSLWVPLGACAWPKARPSYHRISRRSTASPPLAFAPMLGQELC